MTALSSIVTPSGIATLSSAQTLTNKTINGSNNTLSNINLAGSVTGTLPVGNGGTGATTLSGILRGNGTGSISTASAGTDYVAPGTATTFTAKQTFTTLVDVVPTTITASTATTNIDLSTGSVFLITLAANTTFTFSNTPTGGAYSMLLIITNDGTAGRTIAFPTARWAGGAIPPRTTAANAVDVWSFTTPNGGTHWYGSLAIGDAK